jgi:uncharacterized protein
MPNNNQPEREGNKSRRGFASMDDEKKREIASKGGKAAHASGNAHEFTSEEAREAGRKGGQAKGSRSNSQRGGREDRSEEGLRENT